MTGREGVIKFDLAFRPGPLPAAELLAELEGWRTVFRRLGLLGRDPARYEGLGFGNLSRRVPGSDAFIVSGTQTGGLERLAPEHYATVTACDPQHNRVAAHGVTPPSSEALSHGVLYRADPRIAWVMHLHDPAIFAARDRLRLPVTDPAAAYGTPAMAAEIARLAPQAGWPGLLVMGGHEDGLLAFGATAAATGALAVRILAAALAGGLPAAALLGGEN
ncbi:MAG: class II aldolase/adducin family protein [Deltaproteobacteria bacterium]|nr:MAG: class II aldolase/adducin family protein [Deltaproteobacteria bacterium]